MKTRDKILLTALELFNHEGEASVTTLDIAQTLEISPGNLYYHFRGKEDILSRLFDQLYDALLPRLEELEMSLAGLENQPIVLEALFEAQWEYRFAFLDSYRLTTQYPRLRQRLQNLIARQQLAFTRWIEQLENVGLLQFSSDEHRELLVECVINQSTSWMSLLLLRFKQNTPCLHQRAVSQMMSLITLHFSHTDTLSTPRTKSPIKEQMRNIAPPSSHHRTLKADTHTR